MDGLPRRDINSAKSSSIAIGEVTPLVRKANSSHDDLGTNRPTKPRPSYWYAVIPLSFTVFAASGILPSLIDLMNKVLCDRYYDSPSEVDKGALDLSARKCDIPEIQSLVATAQAIFHFLIHASTLGVVSYYGHLSDTKGRVFVFRSSVFGGLLMILMLALTALYPQTFGLSLVFIGAFLRGVFGGDPGLMAAVKAYIADCTDPKERTIAFGRLLASALCATVLGSNFASFIIKATASTSSIFYVALVIVSAILAFSFLIPESVHTHTQQNKVDELSFWDKLNIARSVRTLLTIKTYRVSRMAMPLIATVSFLSSIIVFPPILLYAMLTLGWSAFQAGLLMGAMAFSKLIMSTAIVPMLTKFAIGDGNDTGRILRYNIWMTRIGCFFVAMEMFAIGLARTNSELFIAVLIGSFAMLSLPSVQSLMTTVIDPADVGKVLGASAALDTIGLLIAQLGLNALYSATLAFCPPLTFYVCGVVGLMACACAFLIHPRQDSQSSNSSRE